MLAVYLQLGFSSTIFFLPHERLINDGITSRGIKGSVGYFPQIKSHKERLWWWWWW